MEDCRVSFCLNSESLKWTLYTEIRNFVKDLWLGEDYEVAYDRDNYKEKRWSTSVLGCEPKKCDPFLDIWAAFVYWVILWDLTSKKVSSVSICAEDIAGI